MNTVLVEQSDQKQWDAYVQAHPESSPYHLWAWKTSVEESYGHRGYYFVVRESNKICGVLPLIHMKLPFLQNQLVSLPFCDVGGVLADSPEIERQLLDEAVALAKKLGVKKVEIRTRDTGKLSEQTIQPGTKVSMLLTLPDSSQELWLGFKSKLRSQVRKAEKNGIHFRWGTVEDVGCFYQVFTQNMRDLGSPVHSNKWFESVLVNYGTDARMGIVFLESTPVGCGIILLCGKTVTIPWASTLREWNRLGPNMLLYWNFLKFASENEFEMFDFGRSTIGQGTYNFKAQWGAGERPLRWYELSSRNSGGAEDLKSKASTRRQLISCLWQKLPIQAASFFGPKIRKHISL